MENKEQKEKYYVRIHIDQKPYESLNPTTGKALYILGHVETGLELYREVSGDKEDPSISNGPETVHLKDDEHFHSGPPKEFTIIVNGQQKVVMARKISFTEIVALAFPNTPANENIMFIVTYRKAEDDKKGILVVGQTINVKNGTIFDVTKADKS